MAIANGKATISNLLDQGLYKLLGNQKHQKMPLCWDFVLIMVAASGITTWFVIESSAAIAASGSCYRGKLMSEIVLPIEQTNKRSPISPKSKLLKTHKCPQDTLINVQHCENKCNVTFNQPDSAHHKNPDLKTREIVEQSPAIINLNNQTWVGKLGKTNSAKINKEFLAALKSNFNGQHNHKLNKELTESYLLLSPKVANFEVVPAAREKSAENLRNAEQLDGAQLKLQPTPLPLPKSQPVRIQEKLNVSQANSNSELGNLRLRELEPESRPAASNSELGNLRVRELEPEPRPASNSELGNLRVRELEPESRPASNSELGNLRVRELEPETLPTDGDLELGNVRIREQEPKPTQAASPQYETTVRVLSQVGYFQTNNIFSGVDPVNDGLVSLGLTLLAAPALGPRTALVTAIDGSLIHYVDQSQFDYNQLRFRAGIRQQLNSRMSGELGWNNQQLFRTGGGDRFLNENSIRFALSRRDRLSNKLRLNTFYELRLSDADPERRSRIINSFSVSLSYALRRNLQVGLDYQFALSNFTKRDREDQYHRFLSRLNYSLSDRSQVSVQGGLTFGASSEPNIDFDNFFFSVTYTLELGRF